MFGLRAACPVAALAAALLGFGVPATPARAACNPIPDPPAHPFRGVVGTVNLPFGHPEDPDPAPPDVTSVELGSSPCVATTVPSDPVVTLVFKPPRGTTNLVVLTSHPDCSGLVCDGGESFQCVPNSDLANTGSGVRFRFPNTDALFPPANDKRTFTGPTLIAVSSADSALPCRLARQRCVDPGRPADLFACVDELFANTPGAPKPCSTQRSDLDLEFPHFTALPVSNDWAEICDQKKPPCQDAGEATRFAVGKDGSAWMPVDWSGLGPGRWSVEGGTKIPPAAGAAPPIRIPTDGFLSSFPPNGRPGWPQKPRFDKAPVQPGWLDFEGDVDKPGSVLRFSRREPWGYACEGGDHAAQACNPGSTDDCGENVTCAAIASPRYFACVGGVRAGAYCTQRQDCPGGQCLQGSACVKISGNPPPPPPPPTPSPACYTDLDCAADEECGLGLFEFRDRLEGNAGPFVIPDADYKAKVK